MLRFFDSRGWRMIGENTEGQTHSTRPHFLLIVSAFGFLVFYNVLSWLPTAKVFEQLQVGDLRLDLALPAAVIALAMTSILRDR
jgi:hypothetical protein